MSTVDQLGNHHRPRGGADGGQFASKGQTPPETSLSEQQWPYPTTEFDDGARAFVDEDGENQTCACGNDSFTNDWVAADASGRISPDSQGSADPAEHTVCPSCGLVYLNEDLFGAAETPARPIARFDLSDPRFREALKAYEASVYGA